MKSYIATFFSHFGAIRFKKQCEKQGLTARVMPVPRTLSSSCGTCVSFECDSYEIGDDLPKEVEQIVLVLNDGYATLYKA